MKIKNSLDRFNSGWESTQENKLTRDYIRRRWTLMHCEETKREK